MVGPAIVSATLATGSNALIGLLAGGILAIVFALIASRLTVLDELIAPIVAAIAVVPIVALAPILTNMFGATSETPRRLIVAIVVFVPVFVNTLRGLRQVLTVTFPGALPYIFTGFTIASSLAVISAVVAEYFGGLQNGLGSRITSAAANSAYPRAWAYVGGAILLGLIFFVVTLTFERLANRRR
jgi:NitT/TauT family transport system permease protein